VNANPNIPAARSPVSGATAGAAKSTAPAAPATFSPCGGLEERGATPSGTGLPPASRAEPVVSGIAGIPSAFATDEDIARAIAVDRDWHREAAPSAPYQPRVMVGDCKFMKTRRPFKRNGYWCARNAGVARLLRPLNCASPHWPELLVFPPFYGREEPA
jgi:hypothetical protein